MGNMETHLNIGYLVFLTIGNGDLSGRMPFVIGVIQRINRIDGWRCLQSGSGFRGAEAVGEVDRYPDGLEHRAAGTEYHAVSAADAEGKGRTELKIDIDCRLHKGN